MKSYNQFQWLRNSIEFMVILFATLLFTACELDDNIMKDSRDGKTYKTVKIGEQIWMAENLNYQTPNSFCFDNNEEYCVKFGRLYTWDEALKICPKGWHLPTEDEFKILINTLGGRDVAGQKLMVPKAMDEKTENSGFMALKAGKGFLHRDFDSGDVDYVQFFPSWMFFWSATQKNEYYANCMIIALNGSAKVLGMSLVEDLYPIRCLRDPVN